MKAKIIIDGKECEIVSPEERIKLDDDMFLYGMSVRQNGKRIHPNNMIPDTKPMTNKSILEGWEKWLKQNEVYFPQCIISQSTEEWIFYIKSLLQAQREKDAEICAKLKIEYAGQPSVHPGMLLKEVQLLILTQNNNESKL